MKKITNDLIYLAEKKILPILIRTEVVGNKQVLLSHWDCSPATGFLRTFER